MAYERDPLEAGALWLETSKSTGKKYLSGKIDGRKVVGFFTDKAKLAENPKLPAVRLKWDKPKDEPVYAEDAYEATPDEDSIPF